MKSDDPQTNLLNTLIPITTQLIAIGQPITASLTQEVGTTWTFDVNAGTEVTILLNSETFDPILRITNSNGNVIAEDDDSGSGLNAQIVLRIERSDTYTASVTAWNGKLGEYTLDVQQTGTFTGQESSTVPTDVEESTVVPTATNTPTTTDTPDVPTAEEVAFAGVSSNVDWEAYSPYVRQFSDIEMVLVPAGCFLMGSEDGEADERPEHEVCIDEPYWIDRTEVTHAAFAEFLNDQGNSNDSGREYYDADDEEGDARIVEIADSWQVESGMCQGL